MRSPIGTGRIAAPGTLQGRPPASPGGGPSRRKTARGGLPMRDSWRLPALSGILTLTALALSGPPAGAADAIDTTGATIATGSGSPKGSITIDTNAARVTPTVPAVPAL